MAIDYVEGAVKIMSQLVYDYIISIEYGRASYFLARFFFLRIRIIYHESRRNSDQKSLLYIQSTYCTSFYNVLSNLCFFIFIKSSCL